ncbi:MAG: putative ABC transporter permease [Ruminococcus sp.]|nr:putative ABC transporter permease [Ruminococcus sp.]
MKKKRKYAALGAVAVFLSGGFAYGLIEDISRGFTHISMGILGGMAMLLIHILNSRERTLVKVLARSLMSAVFITLCELLTGELLNVRMGLCIWDYSELPMNLDGQICPLFSGIWFALSAIGSLLDDIIRYFILREKRNFILFGREELYAADTNISHTT